MNDVIDLISQKDFSINVISKSGTTTEPAIAFRIFREIMESKYDLKEARSRIYVTTDKEKGALKTLATKEKYETFVIQIMWVVDILFNSSRIASNCSCWNRHRQTYERCKICTRQIL